MVALADYYVVTERAAFQDARPRLDVGVATDEGVYELGAFTYVGSLGDDAALHRDARRDDDVVGDDRIGADPAPSSTRTFSPITTGPSSSSSSTCALRPT